MKTFTHDQIQEILRSGQKLPDINQDAFVAHLAQCSECQLYAATIAEFSRAVPKIYSSSSLSVSEIRQKAQASKHLLWRKSMFTRLIHGTTGLVWLGATLVILLILGAAIPQLIPKQVAGISSYTVTPEVTPAQQLTNTSLATPTGSASSFVSAANELIQKGQIAQGIQAYKEAVKADPRNPDIYVNLARWQVLAGDYAGAAEDIPYALLLNPNHALAHAVMGWVKGKQGDFRGGQAEIQKSLDLDPNNALAYAYLAEIYTDMIEAGNEDTTTLNQIGPISQKALALDSSLLEVRRARGLALAVTGQHQAAIPEFEAAIAIYGYLPDMHLSLGRSYSAVEIYDRAEAEFRRAIELKPDAPTAYAELARMYLKTGDFAKGISYAGQAVQKDPADPYLHSLVGTLYYKSGDLQSAIASLSLAINGGTTGDGVQIRGIPLDKSPETINLYSRYGLALATTGQCGQALQVATRITEAAPEDESARYNAQVMQDTCRGQASPILTNTPLATVTEVYHPVACDLVVATPIPIQDQPASMIAAEEVYQKWLEAVWTWAEYDQGKQALTLVAPYRGLIVDQVVKDVFSVGKVKAVNTTNIEFVPVEKGKIDPAYIACARWSYPTPLLYCSETRLEKVSQEWKVTDWHWFPCEKQP